MQSCECVSYVSAVLIVVVVVVVVTTHEIPLHGFRFVSTDMCSNFPPVYKYPYSPFLPNAHPFIAIGPLLLSGVYACVYYPSRFVESVVVRCLSTNDRKLSYLMAEASWKRRFIGDIAWALDVVPVKRAQDYSLKGTGTILIVKSEQADSGTGSDDGDIVKVDGNGDDVPPPTPLLHVTGTGTCFQTELKVGDKLRPPGTATAFKIQSIESDTTLVLDGTDSEEVDFAKESTPFDILQKIDQKVVYEKVLDKLAQGGAVGIFPEGGSHDRTDLLPLKVGIALIAYAALEKDGLNIPIVPVGLSYFKGHRFRGRAVVEYGQPIYINPDTLKDYKKGGPDKRRVCNDLLTRIEDSMKSVLVTTPDYDSLQLIHTARRLYQRKGMDASQKQDLSRRFAQGYKWLMLMTEGQELPEE